MISKKEVLEHNIPGHTRDDINSFTVNAVYIRHDSYKFQLVQRRRTRRAHAGKYVHSPTWSLHFFCFRARLVRKCERSDPRLDF